MRPPLRTSFGVLAVALVSLAAGPRTAAAAEQLQPKLPRIVNGVPTQAYPTTGSLLYGSVATGYHICSGTLVGCQTFLTAAHCVDGLSAANLHVYLQHAGIFPVASTTKHPSYLAATFPIADVAVVHLGTPVTGIRPTRINQTSPIPFIPATGTIVGYGSTGGSAQDYGLKRAGLVTTTNCNPALAGGTNTELICWNYAPPVGPPGEDSNTCYGDSGGPLFMDLGAGQVVAGTTSGGVNSACLTTDHSYDANVDNYKPFILGEGGADLTATACGVTGQVGDAAVTVATESATMSPGNPFDRYQYVVGAGVAQLRVTLNAHDDGIADFDLYVKRGSEPRTTDYDCAANGPTQFGACVFDAPAADTWHVLVNRFSGSGDYQLTTTIFPSTCGNGVLEPGEQCDDGNLKVADCCTPQCQYDPAGAMCIGSGCNIRQCDGAGHCVPPVP